MTTRRPSASEPSLVKIIEWWAEADDNPAQRYSDYAGWGEPFCFRCGWMPPVPDDAGPSRAWRRAYGYLERAHLEDYAALRSADALGTDGPHNQVPLCRWCHRNMPAFDVGERESALQWVRDGERCSRLRQMASDAIEHPDEIRPKRRLADVVDRIVAEVAGIALASSTSTAGNTASPVEEVA